MYVRFVTDLRDWRSHQKLGVIRAAWSLEDQMDCADWDHVELLSSWLDRNLRVPHRFSRSRKRHAQKKAVCWFKDVAARPLSKVREIAAILERYNVATRMLKTNRPGYIVYEDDFQVAAIPFRDTMRAPAAAKITFESSRSGR
jgi:hypothetical protein